MYPLSWGDIPRARALLLPAATVLEKVSGPLDLEPLLESARCLALLEIDMPRTRRVFEELDAIGQVCVESMRYQWGLGLVLCWAGDTAGARAARSRHATSLPKPATTGPSSNVQPAWPCSRSRPAPR